MITKERKAVLMACLEGINSEERQFVREYVRHIGYDKLFAETAHRKADTFPCDLEMLTPCRTNYRTGTEPSTR